jgi:hypothetical protein
MYDFLSLKNDVNPFVRGTYPRIRIRTKMSRIRNNGTHLPVPGTVPNFFALNILNFDVTN